MERRPSVFIGAARVSAVLIGPCPVVGLAAGGALSRVSNEGSPEGVTTKKAPTRETIKTLC